MLKVIGAEAKDAGIIRAADDVAKLKFGKFEKGKQGSYLYNYFPHIFKKDIDEDFLENLLTKYGSTETVHGKQRTLLKTTKQIKQDYPDMDIVTDPVLALTLYTKAMTK